MTEVEVTRQDTVGLESNDSRNAGETNMNMFRTMMESMQAHIQNVFQTSTNNLELRLRENNNDLKENLKENNNNLEARLKENQQANNDNLESRLRENLRESSDHLRENLRENSERLGEHVSDLKGEISQMGGDLRNVKESVANMRTHVESQLEIIQAEWNERLDNRFRECKMNFTDR